MRVEISEETNRCYEEHSERQFYESLKSRLESRVATWRWATWPKFGIRPYESEKFRFPKGKWLKSEPEDVNRKYLHGIDKEGHVIVVRGMCELPGLFDEEFFVHSESKVTKAHYEYSRSKRLDVWSQLQLSNGLPVHFEARSQSSITVAGFVHDGGRLVSEHLINECFPPEQQCLDRKYAYTYDDKGYLDLIECIEQDLATGEPPIHYVCYRRPKKGQSKRELAARVAALAVRAIPETLRAARIRDKVFNLLIVYDNENMPLPPSLALGSESFRQRAREQHGTQARCEIWNPAEYEHFNIPTLELKDPELLEACALLNQQMAESDNYQPGRQLLNSVAAQLQQRDWTGILQTTDDFVVTAVDLESQDDLRKNITKSVPPELVKRLKREGLL